MDKKYHIGVHDDSYSKKFRDVKNALLETGLVSKGTPDAMLTKELSNGIEDLIPQNIKLGVNIAGIDGTMRSSLSDWDVDSLLNMEKISYTYTYSDNKNTLYGKNSTSGLFLYNKETKEHRQIFDKGRIFKNYLETFDGDVYIMCYDSVLLTSYVLYIDIDFNCFVVYESTKVNFSTDNTGMHQSRAGHCYFDSGYYTGPYSYNTSTYTGIYYLNKSEPAKQIYGVTPYEEDNGVAWSYPFEDSKGNLYATAFRGSADVLILQGDTVINLSDTSHTWSYSMTEYVEMSDGSIYCWSNANLVALCYIDNVNYTLESLFYGLDWNIIEDNSGNVYASTRYTNHGTPGIYHLRKNVYEKIHDQYYGYYFRKDKQGNIYAWATYRQSTDDKYMIYRVYPDRVEQWKNIKVDFSLINDAQGYLYLSYDFSSSTNASLPRYFCRVDDGVLTPLYSTTSRYTVFYSNKEYAYFQRYSSSSSGLLILRDGVIVSPSDTSISLCDSFKYFEEKDNLYFVADHASANMTFYHIDGANVTKLYTGLVSNYIYEVYRDDTGVYLSTVSTKSFIPGNTYYKLHDKKLLVIAEK